MTTPDELTATGRSAKMICTDVSWRSGVPWAFSEITLSTSRIATRYWPISPANAFSGVVV